jgi:hypothetical protein
VGTNRRIVISKGFIKQGHFSALVDERLSPHPRGRAANVPATEVRKV